jgi:competence protein ComEA
MGECALAGEENRRRGDWTRGQAVAVLVLIAALAGLMYFARHRGRSEQFAHIPGDEAAYALKIDINSAGWQQIALLPGLGPAKAKAIVEHRDAHGRFGSIEDLGAVPGIGEKTVAEIRQYVEIGGADD